MMTWWRGWGAWWLGHALSAVACGQSPWAELRVIDEATGRGVPLVELETVNHLRFVTDNAGRVAFHEPGLMDRELFFTVRSHGYERAADGFGYRGVKVTPRLGRPSEIRIRRTQPAERLCRLTGEGLYRDSVLLGHPVPLERPLGAGMVAGQDSVQAAIYRNRVYWFWGDTLRMAYPLGLFRMAGATTPVPGPADDPSGGLDYDYFVDPESGFARAMMPLPERPAGVIWIFSLMVMPDETGRERLWGHYSRRKGLVDELEHGICVYDDAREVFEVAQEFPLEEHWRRPSGVPLRVTMEGREWWLFRSPNPNVRVPATMAAVLDPARYEAFTCAEAATQDQPLRPQRSSTGEPVWRWQTTFPPTDSAAEVRWIREGLLDPSQARYAPRDIANADEVVTLHRGTVQWNAYRQRWILIVCQQGGTNSFLGEIWYAEAREPTGPFRHATKIATHDRQTFYNVVHHPFLDRDGGRMIHFEGTYTSDFSGNPDRTPRYNYNQVLYRLDLDDPALGGARVE